MDKYLAKQAPPRSTGSQIVVITPIPALLRVGRMDTLRFHPVRPFLLEEILYDKTADDKLGSHSLNIEWTGGGYWGGTAPYPDGRPMTYGAGQWRLSKSCTC